MTPCANRLSAAIALSVMSLQDSELPVDQSRTVQMRRKAPHALHVLSLPLARATRASESNPRPMLSFVQQINAQHRMHILRLHEAGVEFGLEQLLLRQSHTIGRTASGWPVSASLGYDIQLCVVLGIELLKFRVGADHDHGPPRRRQIVLDEACHRRSEAVCEALERCRPTIEIEASLVNELQCVRVFAFSHGTCPLMSAD